MSFDSLYKGKKYYWGLEPSSLVVKAISFVKKGKVLDLGAGEGRDSVFLAKKGFKVLAVDSSKYGIHKLNQLAKIHNVKLKSVVEDITKLKIKGNYDLIICNNVLHFLHRNDVYALIENIKKHTKKKGINVISAFFDDDKIKFSFLFKKRELKSFYENGWEILHYKENSVAELIARKL